MIQQRKVSSAECSGVINASSEVWRPVVGWEGLYEVSDHGNVRSLDKVIERRGRQTRLKGKQRKLVKHSAGYWEIIFHNGIRDHQLVHRVVAAAFLGPCPPGKEVAHWDGNRANPRLENLRYVTRSENHLDKNRHGTGIQGARNHMAKLNERAVRKILIDTRPARLIAAEHGVSDALINMIRARTVWAHVGP